MKIKRTKEDAQWSVLVRERDGKCRNCGCQPPYKLEAHHICPRGRWSTRLLLENGITLCFVCHISGENSVHNIGLEKFIVPLIGQEEYDRLKKLSLKTKSKFDAIKEFHEKYK